MSSFILNESLMAGVNVSYRNFVGMKWLGYWRHEEGLRNDSNLTFPAKWLGPFIAIRFDDAMQGCESED